MAKYTIEEIKNFKEMGILTEADASALIKAIVMADLNGGNSGSNNNGGNKQGTGSKGGRRRLTDEEKEAKAKEKAEARKAEKLAWAEAQGYTEEDRKAYGAKKQAERELAEIRKLAYLMTKRFFGKKVSKEEWDKKYNETVDELLAN